MSCLVLSFCLPPHHVKFDYLFTLWQKAGCMGPPMRFLLITNGLLVHLANHYVPCPSNHLAPVVRLS